MILDWITDPHLNHLSSPKALIRFAKKLYDRPSHGLLITGDIAESHTLSGLLSLLYEAYQRPIFFILGNHDYYGDWIKNTRETVNYTCHEFPKGALNWLTETGPIFLNKKTALIGHDGFYDGKQGSPGLELTLSDFFMPHGIKDLIKAFHFGSHTLFEKLNELGEESTQAIIKQTRQAAQQGAKHIITLTHVPPFIETSYFKGRPSSEQSAPFYVNQGLGVALRELSKQYPKVSFEVLCGHTHTKRMVQITPNLTVKVGGSQYGSPNFQDPIEI